MTADLRDVPPIFGTFDLDRPDLLQGRAAARLPRSRSSAPSALQWMIKTHLSRQGDPRHGAGRRGRDADGHSGAAHLPDHLRRRLGAGRACRLRHGAAVLGISDGRPEFRPDRLRHRRAGRHGQHRGRAARRHLRRRGAIAEQLLRRAGLRADVLLHPVPAGHDLPAQRVARSEGRRDASA